MFEDFKNKEEPDLMQQIEIRVVEILQPLVYLKEELKAKDSKVIGFMGKQVDRAKEILIDSLKEVLLLKGGYDEEFISEGMMKCVDGFENIIQDILNNVEAISDIEVRIVGLEEEDKKGFSSRLTELDEDVEMLRKQLKLLFDLLESE